MSTGHAAIIRCDTEDAAENVMYLLGKIITLHQRDPRPAPSLSVFKHSGSDTRSEKLVRVWEYQRCYRHHWVGDLLETDTVQRKYRKMLLR